MTVFDVCKQQMRRPPCASTQSGQNLCYSLYRNDKLIRRLYLHAKLINIANLYSLAKRGPFTSRGHLIYLILLIIKPTSTHVAGDIVSISIFICLFMQLCHIQPRRSTKSTIWEMLPIITPTLADAVGNIVYC